MDGIGALCKVCRCYPAYLLVCTTSLQSRRQACQLTPERIGTVHHGVLTLSAHDKAPRFQLVYMANDRSD